MIHTIRWTAKKISQCIDLIEPLVYRQRHPLPPFRHTALPDPHRQPPVGIDVDDKDWPAIEPNTYWGDWMTDYALRTSFQVPNDWDSAPVSLYLPLGEEGDFSNPKALAYIDGVPFVACDRHHQEILLPEQCQDGQAHQLALHTWTGLGGWRNQEPGTRLFMHPCAVLQVDQPTRDFLVTARVALGVAECLEPVEPAKGHLLNALDEAFKILDTFRERFGPDAESPVLWLPDVFGFAWTLPQLINLGKAGTDGKWRLESHRKYIVHQRGQTQHRGGNDQTGRGWQGRDRAARRKPATAWAPHTDHRL
jgi:hypothetical protein